MKPAKGLYPFATWLLRISMPVLAYSVFFNTVKTFDFTNIHFYIAAIFCLSSLLLFIGAFLSKHSLTVISAFVLFGISVYEAIHFFNKSPDINFSLFLLSSATMLLILSIGNKH